MEESRRLGGEESGEQEGPRESSSEVTSEQDAQAEDPTSPQRGFEQEPGTEERERG
jgi:hypothetical protein